MRQALERRGGSSAAPYAVEVALSSVEKTTVGPGLGAGLAAETGVLAAGSAAGAIIGSVVPGLGTAVGLTVGMLAASGPALLTASSFDTRQAEGELRAVVALRRRSDRVPVAMTHVRVPWRTGLNVWTARERLERSAGDAVVELEAQLVHAIDGLVAEVDAAN